MEENQNEREFFTLVDDDGQEIEFELIATAKIKDTTYYAVIPMDGSVQAEDGFCEYVILKGELDENGEGTLVSFGVDGDDEDEVEEVESYFDNLFSEEIDYDGEN